MKEQKEINYTVTIKTEAEVSCAEIDPIGLCTPTDCMICKNARIKIVRDDGVVMRDDDKNDKNAGYEKKLNDLRYEYKADPIGFFENIVGVRLTKADKAILKAAKRWDVL